MYVLIFLKKYYIQVFYVPFYCLVLRVVGKKQNMIIYYLDDQYYYSILKIS
jgi:hypothetical protein